MPIILCDICGAGPFEDRLALADHQIAEHGPKDPHVPSPRKPAD